MKRYKELRRRQKEYRRGLGHSVVVASPATPGVATSNAISIDSDHTNADAGDNSTKEDKLVPNGTSKVKNNQVTKRLLNNTHFMKSFGVCCMSLIVQSNKLKTTINCQCRCFYLILTLLIIR